MAISTLPELLEFLNDLVPLTSMHELIAQLRAYDLISDAEQIQLHQRLRETIRDRLDAASAPADESKAK